jgi:hypothetical protein
MRPLGALVLTSTSRSAAELAEIGVTWLTLRLPAPDLAAFLRNVERLGSQIAR